MAGKWLLKQPLPLSHNNSSRLLRHAKSQRVRSGGFTARLATLSDIQMIINTRTFVTLQIGRADAKVPVLSSQ
jgi:hypothetical protein